MTHPLPAPRGVKFQIVRASVVEFPASAIVNAANSSLLGGGGVDGAIHRAAGPELYHHCRNLGGCKTGEAKMTPAFGIGSADHIIHTVGPVYRGHTPEEAKRLLQSCYTESLAHDLESIAFSGISTGIYGYPMEEAVRAAIEAITGWLEAHPQSTLQSVTLCAFTQDEYERMVAAV